VDLGCAYKLTVDEQDHGLLHVTAGWVELDYKGRKSTVPAGMLCETRPGVGPGTPFSEDAPPTLRRALVRFDFEQGGQEALVEALAGARPQDGVMLRHLLKRVDQEARGMVFDRMAELGLTPDGASTADDMRGDENMERVEKPLESETP
jgi:hypothetical protein